MVLGGLTAPLVSWLKIPNEIDGTLDLKNIEAVFNDEEKDYLCAIKATRDKWEAYLLIHGSDNAHNANNGTARGRDETAWEAIKQDALSAAKRSVERIQVRSLPPTHSDT